MATIKLNYDYLKRDCVSNLEDVINELERVERYFSLMNIPYDYNKRIELQKIRQDLNDCNSEIKKLRSWIIKSNSEFDTKLLEYQNRSNRLPVNGMKKRGQKI